MSYQYPDAVASARQQSRILRIGPGIRPVHAVENALPYFVQAAMGGFRDAGLLGELNAHTLTT